MIIYFGSDAKAAVNGFYVREKYHELSRTDTNISFIRLWFVLAFEVFLTNSCSISEYILVNPDEILAILKRFKPNSANPAEKS